MQNAYTLFGELKADTNSFKNSLRDADQRLVTTKKNIEVVEAQSRSLGVTTASAGRQFERLNETLNAAQSRLAVTAQAFKAGEASQSQMRAALIAVERAAASVGSRLSDAGARAQDFAARTQAAAQKAADRFAKEQQRMAEAAQKAAQKAADRFAKEQQRMAEAAQKAADKAAYSWTKFADHVSGVGNALSNIGTKMSLALTAPLAALGYASTQSASSLDTLRTKLQAATGTAEAANVAFEHLRKLSMQNAGVLTEGAVSTFTFLKPLGLLPGTIDEVIKAFGKLKSANPEIDLQRMSQNLTQLFKQDFERSDLKEALGAFPRLGEVMQKAFGLAGSDLDSIAEGMKALKAEGLSMEDMFAKLAKGINTDEFLKNIADPIEVRMAKMKERIFFALEPIGKIILSAMERVLPPITNLIEQISTAFANSPQLVQTLTVALAGLAAVAGPALVAIGAAISAIATPAVGIALLAIIGLIVQIGPAIAIAAGQIYLLYQAWQTNFGGIQEITFGAIEKIRGAIQGFLAAIESFWNAHGVRIMATLNSLWEVVASVTNTAMTQIQNYMRLGMQLINGDWTGAWNTFLTIIKDAAAGVTNLLIKAISHWGNVLKTVIPIVTEWGLRFLTTITSWVAKAIVGVVTLIANLPTLLIRMVPMLIQAGFQIGEAIKNGIMQGIASAVNGSVSGSAGASLGGGFLDELLKSVGLDNAGQTVSAGANVPMPSSPVGSPPVVSANPSSVTGGNAESYLKDISDQMRTLNQFFRTGKGKGLVDINIRGEEDDVDVSKMSDTGAMYGFGGFSIAGGTNRN